MSVRISVVNNIKIVSVSTSAIVQIGDASKVKPRSKTIEAERKIPSFIGNEVNFPDYPIFKMPIPQPAIQENAQMVVKNKSPWIKVNQVNIIDLSESAVFQVGCNQSIDTEARYKQIRPLQ